MRHSGQVGGVLGHASIVRRLLICSSSLSRRSRMYASQARLVEYLDMLVS